MANSNLVDLLLQNTSRSSNITSQQYDQYLRSYTRQLRSLGQEQPLEDLQLLQICNPANNTLGYLFLLANLRVDPTSDLYLLSLTSFLDQCDPIQIRFAGQEWKEIYNRIEFGIKSGSGNPHLLSLYRNAILRMDPLSQTLTSHHKTFINLCLSLGRPREALTILDRDIFHLPSNVSIKDAGQHTISDRHVKSYQYITTSSDISLPLSIYDIQEYYLFGAQIYIGLRNFTRARLFLETVLATPTLHAAINIHMVEAYKKLILVELIRTGRSLKLISSLDSVILRKIQSMTKAYSALSDSFVKRDVRKFHAEVDVAASAFDEDGNSGLVQETSHAISRYRLMDLSKTYIAMTIEEVSKHLDQPVNDTTQYIQSLIQAGEISATLTLSNISPSLILRFTFPSTPTTFDNDTIISRIDALNNAVKEADRKCLLSKEYNDHLHRSKATFAAENRTRLANHADLMDMDNDPGHIKVYNPINSAHGHGHGYSHGYRGDIEDDGDDEDIMAS